MIREELLTVEEAANWLAVSKPTIRRMISRGEIPIVRIAQRNVRIKLSDLEKYIESNYGRIEEINIIPKKIEGVDKWNL